MSKEHYEENDRRMNIIGQNGNDGLHYDEVEGKPFKDTVEERLKRDPEFKKALDYKTGEIADSDKVINIVVEGGMVVEVNGLPVDWQYYIDDRDCPPEIEDE